MTLNIVVAPKIGRPTILFIFLNDQEWKSIHTAIFGRQPSFPECATMPEWENTFASIEYQKVKNYVLNRLSAQQYHSLQLRKLLIERLVNAATIDRIIAECLDKGFLNDELWLESFIRSNRKRLGMPAIMRKLQTKGIAVDELRNKWHDPDQDRQNIKQLILKRYRSKNLGQFQDRQKVIAALMRKGFSFDVILSTLEEF